MRMTPEEYQKLIKQHRDKLIAGNEYARQLAAHPEQDATKWGQPDSEKKKPKKAKKPTRKESYVLGDCIGYLKRNGCHVWRNNTGGFYDKNNRYVSYGEKGSPDIIGMLPSGRFIGVETKREGKKAEPHQLAFGEKITHCNGLYIVAHSMDELADALEGML